MSAHHDRENLSSPADSGEPSQHHRAGLLLALGALAGLALAALGLLQGGPGSADTLPSGVVAMVNGRALGSEEFARAVAALASDRRDPLGETERRHVLNRLVEEELLVQRGIELGLARHDRRVRGDIVSAVIQSVVSGADAGEPSDDDLEAFYRENLDYFARSGRLRVQQVWIRARTGPEEPAARARAEQAARRLRAGEPLDAVRAALGDRELPPLPDALLPPTKLREYLGPTATRAALELAPGGVSDPVRSATGFHVLVLIEREERHAPPLEAIGDQVRAELRRRQGDRALRSYLDELRDRAELRVADPLP